MSEPIKQRKPIKKIISDVVFAVIMSFLGIIVIFSIIEKTAGFSISGHHLLWVKTNSMETTIPAQSYILVKDVDAKDVKPNDIITFISESEQIKGNYNTHRVVRIDENGDFITKGDNCISEDYPPVKAENVVYLYERNMPFISFFGRLFASPLGYGLTVVGIVGLVAVWFTLDYKDRKKEQKQELINEMVKEEVERLENEAKNQDNK